MADNGQYGSINDRGVLRKSAMGKAFEDGDAKLLTSEKLAGCPADPLQYLLQPMVDIVFDFVLAVFTVNGILGEEMFAHPVEKLFREKMANYMHMILLFEFYWITFKI